MGIRQALGFVFIELWYACKTELLNIPDGSELKSYFEALIRGAENGIKNAEAKYKGLLRSLGSGFVSGALASTTTTICNMFFETNKRTVSNIRFAYAAIVHAGNVLLFNPSDLLLGDRLQTATVILATGANSIVGAWAGNIIEKTPVGKDETVGKYVCSFVPILVSGLLSCTFLLILDRSKFIKETVEQLNLRLTPDQDFRERAAEFEALAACISGIDTDQFHTEIIRLGTVADRILGTEDENSLLEVLSDCYETCEWDTPWTGDFDSFMADKNKQFVFG